VSARGRGVGTDPDRPAASDRNTVNGKHGPAWRAVEADDRALDALAAVGPGSDDPAFRLLAAWRDDIDADPPVPLPAHVPPPRSRYQRRGRRRRRMGVAAGLAVLATSGMMTVALFSATAQPGSPLFEVTKVIYPDTAAYRERLATAQRDIYHAKRAAAAGREDDARRYLDDADRHSRDIDGDDADRVRRQADQVREHLNNGKSDEAHSKSHSTGPGSSAAPSSSPTPAPSDSASASPSPSPSDEASTESSEESTASPNANANATKSPDNNGKAKGKNKN
jgi:hypothetical protein